MESDLEYLVGVFSGEDAEIGVPILLGDIAYDDLCLQEEMEDLLRLDLLHEELVNPIVEFAHESLGESEVA